MRYAIAAGLAPLLSATTAGAHRRGAGGQEPEAHGGIDKIHALKSPVAGGGS